MNTKLRNRSPISSGIPEDFPYSLNIRTSREAGLPNLQGDPEYLA